MRGRYKKWASPFLESHKEFVLTSIDINDKFFLSPSLHLEIGAGKGDFVIGMSKKYPNVNFLAIEKDVSVSGILAKKVLASELPNIRVINGDCDLLYEELSKLKFDCIYLNFSDPWPKKRHEKRRLTHHKRLEMLEKLLKDGGMLKIKTDNDSLYSFTLEEIKESPFEMFLNEENYIFDEENDIQSEYEKNFRATGKDIHRVYLKKKMEEK